MVFARWRLCAPHRIHASLGPPKSTTQTVSWLVQSFLHSLQQCRLACLCMPFPLKIAPLLGQSGSTSNTRFLGPIWAHNRNSILIGSAVSAQLMAEPYISCCLTALKLKFLWCTVHVIWNVTINVTWTSVYFYCCCCVVGHVFMCLQTCAVWFLGASNVVLFTLHSK